MRKTRLVVKLGACCVAFLLSLGVADRLYGPFGVSSRGQHTECISNLHELDGAIGQFAIEHGKTNGESVTLADLAPYLNGGHLRYGDTCPFGGHYEVRTVELAPTCSLGTNRISWGRHGWLWLVYTNTPDSGNMHRIR
jgi:hypothetical protein